MTWRDDLAQRRDERMDPHRRHATDMIEQGHRVMNARAAEDTAKGWPNTARLVRVLRDRTEGNPT